jgi:uncharacterized circularly permuted ATP-grasp superfamily protein/uncharacterized alpha-E superfamily protein
MAELYQSPTTIQGCSEVYDPARGLVPPHAALLHRLQQFSPEELRLRQARIEKAAGEMGFHFSIRETNLREDTQAWKLDLIPRIVRSEEWDTLSAGLIQRARAFNAFLVDIFDEQRILRERVIPYEVVLGDSAYLRECFRLPVAENNYLLIGATDLVRTNDGRWHVSHNHYSTPVGISYILQHRRMLTQAMPELFQEFPVQPISSFSTQLVESLAALSPQPNPHIVLLSRADSNEGYFEESFLARRMGIALVRPADLLVRDSQVFLRTVAGLERIDVIYRRTGSGSIDPIAFDSAGFRGVPGLVNCVRKGTVAVSNALGCGLADSKALLRYSDSIIRFYLNQEPILPTLPTYHCSDRDQLEYVLQNLDAMVLKPVHRDRETPRLIASFERDMHTLLKKNPAEIVAQPATLTSTYPRLDGDQLIPASVYFRAFVLLGRNPYVMPGGLTRFSMEKEAQNQLGDNARGSKDTWILAAKKPKASLQPPSLRFVSRVRDFAVSSRVAEQLYWIGRYIERAENTARMLRVLEEARWDDLGAIGQGGVWPLWRAIALATGHEDVPETKAEMTDTLPLSRSLLLSGQDPASIRNCVRAAHNNAQSIREFITPEFWTVLNRLEERFLMAPEPKQVRRAQLRDFAQQVVDEISCLNGTAQRTMPHDDGWQFFKLGTFLERGICTITVLENVLPQAAALEALQPEENPDLTTLLRLLGSLDAYRREFRARAYANHVAELLWKNEETPSSLAFCSRNMIFTLESIVGQRDGWNNLPIVVSVRSLLDHLRSLNGAAMFPQPNLDSDNIVAKSASAHAQMQNRIEKQSALLREKLEKVHQLLEDAFFSHQEGLAPPSKTSAA